MPEPKLDVGPAGRWVRYALPLLLIATMGCSQWRPVSLKRSWDGGQESVEPVTDSRYAATDHTPTPPDASAESDAQARILGVYQTEDTPAVTLQAVSASPSKPKLAPIPEALLAGLEEDLPTTESQPVTAATGQCPHGGDCDCQRKKVVPILAIATPVDPSQLPPREIIIPDAPRSAPTQPQPRAESPIALATPETPGTSDAEPEATPVAVAKTSQTWPSPAPIFESEPAAELSGVQPTTTAVPEIASKESPSPTVVDRAVAIQEVSDSAESGRHMEIRVAEVCMHCQSIACAGECQAETTQLTTFATPAETRQPTAEPVIRHAKSGGDSEREAEAEAEAAQVDLLVDESREESTADLDIPFDPDAFEGAADQPLAVPCPENSRMEAVPAFGPDLPGYSMPQGPDPAPPSITPPPSDDNSFAPATPIQTVEENVDDAAPQALPSDSPWQIPQFWNTTGTTTSETTNSETANSDELVFEVPQEPEGPLPVPVDFGEENPWDDFHLPLLPDDGSFEAPRGSTTSPAEQSPPVFTVCNPALCTRIWGFGQFQRCPNEPFSGTGRMLVYCEVENQTSTLDAVDQRHHTRLEGRILIHDQQGRLVQSVEFDPIEDIADQRRDEFYLYFPLRLKSLPRGDYQMTVSVRDLQATEATRPSASLPLSVR